VTGPRVDASELARTLVSLMEQCTASVAAAHLALGQRSVLLAAHHAGAANGLHAALSALLPLPGCRR
jgi:hypothetical protein